MAPVAGIPTPIPVAPARGGRLAHWQWRLKKARADRADRTGRPFTYSHSRLGRFIYHPGDYLTRRVFLYDDFERAEIAFARERSSHGGVLLDVGANIGLYAVVCARAAGPDARVIAVEPAPATFEKLERTCARLELPQIVPMRLAAAAQEGIASLVVGDPGRDIQQHLADTRPTDGGRVVSVRCARLDDVCGEPAAVTFMKLDVEGHEMAALDGASAILGHRRASLVVECHPDGLAAAGTSPADLWARLIRTHECTAVVYQDGSIAPGRLASVGAPPGGTCNTLWTPARP